MTDPEPITTTLLRAAAFAAEHHRGQRRKDADATPYINHPLEVAETLATVGGVTDPDVLVAALLHDTVEDTPVEPSDIEAAFGAAVRGYVEEMTDDKRLPKEERKRLQIDHAPRMSPAAAQIKLADKICNCRDLGRRCPTSWPPERIRTYFDWAEEVIAGLPPCNPALEAFFRKTVAEARRKTETCDA